MTDGRGYPTDSLGFMRGWTAVVNVAQPAAGADWSYKLPGGYLYRLIGGSAMFTTSATVANRAILVEFTDGANIVTRLGTGSTFTASLSVFFGMIPAGNTTAVNGVGPNMSLSVPSKWLQPGYVIQSHTLNIQAADQWTSVVLWLEQIALGDLHQQYDAGAPTVLTGQL